MDDGRSPMEGMSIGIAIGIAIGAAFGTGDDEDDPPGAADTPSDPGETDTDVEERGST